MFLVPLPKPSYFIICAKTDMHILLKNHFIMARCTLYKYGDLQ